MLNFMPRVILSTTDVRNAKVKDFVHPRLLTGYTDLGNNRYRSPALNKVYVLDPGSTDGNGSLEILDII
jgi:hypothetical protein